ncbi:MAG: MFS transporter [Rhodospirillaceae bacterium]|nr:MFS transporter [Rhodospirillaceae bacterium]
MSYGAKRAWLITLISGGVLAALTLGIRQGFGLFLPPMTEDLGITREGFALAIATQNLLWGASSPFFGGLADRYGARKVLFIGGLLYGAGLLLMGNAIGMAGVITGQALIGLGMGGAGISIVLGPVGRAVPVEKRSMALGLVTAGGSFGQFVMVPATQSLISEYGWVQALFLLGLFAAIAIWVFSLGLGEEKKPDSDYGLPQSISSALGEALSHKGFILLTTGFFVCGFQVVFIATHLPAFLQDKGVDAATASWALALVGLFNILGATGAGWLGGKMEKRLSLAWFYIIRSIIIATFILLPISGNSALLFGAVIGIFWLGTIPLTSGLISTFFGARYLSMLYGIVFVSHQLGSFAGAWYGGYLYVTTGSYEIMWWLTVAAGFIAGGLHWIIREEPAHRLRPAQ